MVLVILFEGVIKLLVPFVLVPDPCGHNCIEEHIYGDLDDWLFLPNVNLQQIGSSGGGGTVARSALPQLSGNVG
jgi:hypothetical protein